MVSIFIVGFALQCTLFSVRRRLANDGSVSSLELKLPMFRGQLLSVAADRSQPRECTTARSRNAARRKKGHCFWQAQELTTAPVSTKKCDGNLVAFFCRHGGRGQFLRLPEAVPVFSA